MKQKIAPLLLIFIALIFCSEVIAKPKKLLPPPVDLEIFIKNTPIVGEEIEVVYKIKSSEDLHIHIKCILPNGVAMVEQKGIILQPFEGYISPELYNSEIQYHTQADLFIGQIKANETYEYSFKIRVVDTVDYHIIAVITALEKYGSHQEDFIVKGEV